MSEKPDDIDVEENSLMDQIIKVDQAMTQEQRREHNRKRRLDLLYGNLRRVREYAETAPSVITARFVFSIFRTAWALWEADMKKAFGDWMCEQFRKNSHRCLFCGDDLPQPIDRSGMCPKCLEEADATDERSEA